jgi:hypothetical protein
MSSRLTVSEVRDMPASAWPTTENQRLSGASNRAPPPSRFWPIDVSRSPNIVPPTAA